MSNLTLTVFSADWCGPCDTQHDLLEDFDAIPVEYVDIDENAEMAAEYNITSIPTMILFNDDDGVVDRWSGVTQPYTIEKQVNRYSDE